MSVNAFKESLLKIKDYKEQINSLDSINVLKPGWNDDSIRVLTIQKNSFNRLLSTEMNRMNTYKDKVLIIKEELDEVEKLYDSMFKATKIVVTKSYEEVVKQGRKNANGCKTVVQKHKMSVIPLEGMASLKEALPKSSLRRSKTRRKYLKDHVKKKLKLMSKDSCNNKSYEELCEDYKSGKLIIK
jgi:hypothetical protein